jgi:outer membrane lipoprotein
MKVSNQIRLFLAGACGTACLLVVAGCSTVPISKPWREKATKADFVTILQNLESHQGNVVIWGGKIIQTVNQTNGASVYVLESPLDSEGRPMSEKLSQGRFIAHHPGFLDPEVYRAGARITIAGEMAGKLSENIGQTPYIYPVVTLKEVYFWNPATFVYAEPYYWGWSWYWPYGPYPYYPYPYRYYYPYRHYHYP